MKKKKVLIVPVLVAVIVLAAFLVSHWSHKPEEGVLLLSGNVEVTEPNVGFKIPGRVTGLLVDEGQRVQTGARLATLDSAELESVVAQNRAALGEARVRLAELKAGSRIQEIEQAKAEVSSAEAELVKAQKDYERADRLFKNEAIPASQYDSAKRTHETARAQLKSALERLSLVKEGPRKEEIRAQEDRVRQLEAGLKTSEEKLKDTVIYAPVSGVVLRKNVELGETVAAGVPVFTIGELEDPWIKVYVKEDKIGLVRLGQKARVSTDSYPGKTYEGTVTFISSEAEFTPKIVQTHEERVKLVFGIKVKVKNVGDELKPGMPADVRIELK
ncbi:MAG: efflux RND transporter periplasmic adaptor subunit [Chloroflexota bacterium]